MTLDFVTDLTQKIDSQGIKYFVITLQPGKTENRVHLFNNIDSDEILESFAEIFMDILDDMAGPPPKKKKKKK